MKRSLLALLIIVSLCACQAPMVATPADPPLQPSAEQVLHLMKTNNPPTLHPWYASDEHSILVLGNVNSGLFNLDIQREVVEDLARSSAMSADGLSYTFQLKEGFFVNSNGEPVAPITASDFEYSWKKLADSETGSAYRSLILTAGIKGSTKLFQTSEKLDELDRLSATATDSPDEEAVEEQKKLEQELSDEFGSLENARQAIPKLIQALGVKATSDNQLIVELERPVPFFKDLLCFPAFFPMNQAFVESHSDYGQSAESTLYTGAYYLSDWTEDTAYRLTKNPNYWAAYQVDLAGVEMLIEPEGQPEAEVEAYLNGQIDWTHLSGENIKRYENRPDTWYRLEASVVYVEINQASTGKNKELLASAQMRKALNQAINKQRLTEEVLGNGSVATDALYPKSFQLYDGRDVRLLDQRYSDGYNPYDLDAAKANWVAVKQQLQIEWPTIELVVNDDDSSLRVAQFLKEEWEKNLTGLKVDLRTTTIHDKLERLERGDFELALGGWAPDYPDLMTFANLFLSGSSHNRIGFISESYDTLVEAAMKERLIKPGQELARFRSLLEAERVLLQEEQAIIPLYQRGTVDLLNPQVRNLIVQIVGPKFQFKYVEIE